MIIFSLQLKKGNGGSEKDGTFIIPNSLFYLARKDTII